MGGKKIMINLQIQIQTEKAVEIVKSHGYSVVEKVSWRYTDRTTEEGYYHTDYYCYEDKVPEQFIYGTHDLDSVVAKILNLKILQLLLCEQPTFEKELNLVQKIEKALNLREGSVMSSMRYRPIIDAKIIATRLLYDELKHATYTGKLLNCDHSTVLHRLAKFEDYFATDAVFREKFHKVKDFVYDRNQNQQAKHTVL